MPIAEQRHAGEDIEQRHVEVRAGGRFADHLLHRSNMGDRQSATHDSQFSLYIRAERKRFDLGTNHPSDGHEAVVQFGDCIVHLGHRHVHGRIGIGAKRVVSDVADNADDFTRRFIKRWTYSGANRDALPHRIFIRPELLGQGSVDYYNAIRGSVIAVREQAPTN